MYISAMPVDLASDTTITIDSTDVSNKHDTSPTIKGHHPRWVLVLVALSPAGYFGVHHFMMGDKKRGNIYLILTAAILIFSITLFALYILKIIDAVNIITGKTDYEYEKQTRGERLEQKEERKEQKLRDKEDGTSTDKW